LSWKFIDHGPACRPSVRPGSTSAHQVKPNRGGLRSGKKGYGLRGNRIGKGIRELKKILHISLTHSILHVPPEIY
jgi:hypothetical protein